MSHHPESVGPGEALGLSASLSPPPHCHGDEEEEDLNKAFDVQCFPQIFGPAAVSPPDKHRVYDEQDFEDHRHCSLHVQHPLSKPPADVRRKRTNEGRREGRRGSAPSAAATIEEDQEEESCSQTMASRDLPTTSTNHNTLSRGSTMMSVATDDADEVGALMSVDLDGIKSHRLDDVPAVRRHLVRRSSRGPIVHISKDQIVGQSQLRPDRTPHEVFVELNELMIDRNHELQWRETARWIKFEEEVEEETERWGRPHVASLSFRSLLELRKTISHGAVLLDLKQRTLPDIAQQVAEQMVISDQIKAEDRTNVLRALLLRHSHPSDEKDHSLFSRNISAANMAALIDKHNGQSELSPDLTNHKEADPEKTKREAPPPCHSRSKHEAKLMEKIPERAEATVVLVGSVSFLDQPSMAFVRLQEAVLLESVLEVPVPVRFLFLLLGPPVTNIDYHQIGRSISTLMSDKHFHEAAYQADDRQDLLTAINRFLDCSVVLPPSEVDGDELLHSVARFQREMLQKREEEQGSKLQDKQSSIQQHEDSLVPSKPSNEPLRRSGRLFGGLVKDVVRRYPQYLSDIRDALNPQCMAAIIFIYFAALSPAITFGGLLGEKTEGLIGVSELIVATAMQGIVFSVLGAQPLLVIGFSGPLLVFEEAFYTLRRIIGDFGVPIAILIMVLVDYSVEDTYTQKLNVPSGFSVSSPEKRGWMISPLGSDGQFPIWMMGASILPAILVFILIFMESQITALIVSKKERMLVKGTGFHLDLLIIVVVGGISALFGLPWLSAATVRSVTHTNALTVMSKAVAPGDKPRIQEVKEQRVTGFLVAVLVGLSIVIGEVLRQIPLAVLFGIFLYMGVMSLNGIQLTERLILLLMPSKYHPDQSYVRKVRTLRMHMFTLVQLTCLSLLWVVMATAAALAFPFVLLLTIPVRMLLLPHLFTRRELQSLDADDVESHLEEKEGQDEYSQLQMPV
ncbi:anion exchange protein 2a isoform X2 [Paralichthys olivaceus]|uniref:anion exchange protein 2a isoform X2 n=1 Tax=Paralichthys olivaceus TaxID=8255 RepID=UPI003751EB08